MGEYVLGSVLCGMLTVMGTNGLINKIRCFDVESNLPEKRSIKEYVLFFLCGAVSYQGVSITTGIILGLSLYLSFMAYTDYHTRNVYAVYSYMVFLVGVFYLFTATENWKHELVCLVVFFAIVLLGFLVKAYAFGDVEILMALYPYIVKLFFAETESTEKIVQVVTWYCLTLLLSVLTSIRFRPFALKKDKAMAPVITFAFAVSMCIYKFL